MTFSSGLEEADEALKNRVCKLIEESKMYKARVVSCPDAGSYVIEIPHVTETLIKEKLLPSGESAIHQVTCSGIPRGGEPPPLPLRNSKVLPKLSRIPSSVEYTPVTT
jgi:hypothetical protein